MSLSTLLFLTSVMLPGAPGTTPATDIFDAIDSRYQQSTIDAETRHLYRVAAVRRPDLLPWDLRELALRTGGAGRRSLTPLFVEAMRWVQANDAHGGVLHQLLLPLDDLDFVLDSATHPIRVSYATAAEQQHAEWTLEYAEISWDVLTLQYGFWEPPIEPGTERYRFYIASTYGNGAAYTAPYGENPDTPHTDSFSYIVVDPASNNEWSIAGTVAHELNHATQAAMDNLEPTVFWENTATYIMSQVFPGAMYFTVGMMYLFQEHPWRALDYMIRSNSDGSEYGGGLFVWYLADTFAPEDRPQFVAQIWQNCVQNSQPNDPDYFDAIELTVAARGFDLTMEEILLDFSEARYFVGGNDDGEHIHGAWQFDDAEVPLVAGYNATQLPLIDVSAPESTEPASFGSNHILMNLPTGYTHPISVRLNGADDTRWAARAVLFGGGADTVGATLDLVADSWDATVVVQPAGHDSLLLVVANLGEDGYGPGRYLSNNWPVSTYTYSIAAVLDPPSISALEPAVTERGQQNVSFLLRGSGFMAGGQFDIEFVDPKIQDISIIRVLPDEVSFRATIPLLTELGEKDLILTNSDGQKTTATGILTVVEYGTVIPDGGVGPVGDIMGGGGCDCRSASRESFVGDALPLLFPLVLLLALVWRRRRR